MSCVSVLLARSQCRTSVTNFSRILKHQNVGNFSGSSSCRSLCSSAYHEKSRQPAIRDFEVRPNILALYNLGLFPNGSRPFSTGQIRCKEEDKAVEKEDVPKKVGVVAKFKQMCRDYWYILVPVHAVTSVVWFSSFYVLCKSGIDVASLLSSFGVSEAYLEKIASSEWSYVALATACYKLASPARYTVTVGSSTLAIKYLKDWGYLKTSGEVARGFRDKMDVVEDKVKVGWEKYAENRRSRRRVKRGKKSAKSKEK